MSAKVRIIDEIAAVRDRLVGARSGVSVSDYAIPFSSQRRRMAQV